MKPSAAAASLRTATGERPDHPPAQADAECASCGYSLRGLDASSLCPECAVPVQASLVGGRRGSAWQRKPGLEAWLATARGLALSPRTFWDDVRVEESRSWELLVASHAAAALLSAAAAMSGTLSGGGGIGSAIIAGICLWGGVYVLLLMLTVPLGVAAGVTSGSHPARVQTAVCHASIVWPPAAAALIAALAIGSGSLALGALLGALGLSLVWTWIGARRLRYVVIEQLAADG